MTGGVRAGGEALALEGIVKRFGGAAALDGASVRVRAGTLHALLGENGAGKTTLMRVAFGMARPDAGAVRVFGRAGRPRTPAEAIAAGVGMVHQHFTLVPAMTVIYAGHYATETLGVRALSAHLSERFDVPWTFVEAPTGL